MHTRVQKLVKRVENDTCGYFLHPTMSFIKESRQLVTKNKEPRRLLFEALKMAATFAFGKQR